MAANEVYEDGEQIAVTLASKTSGMPVVFGQIPGVALNNTDTDGKVTITTKGVYNLSVKGTSGSNAAIAVGAIIYYVEADTPKLSITTSGVRFGYALEAVASGATTTIRVKLGY